jgi:energy-converting hydrogenase Eha subunit A
VKQVILPATAVADHTAAAPGNQQAFNVGFVTVPADGCALPLPVTKPQYFTWVSSDPVNAPISNVAATAGVATCVGATTVPATISVSSVANVQTAALTCK